MIKTVATAGAACLAIALATQAFAAPPADDPLVAIPPVAGAWKADTVGLGRHRFGHKTKLRYLAPVFPRLSLNLISLECELPGNHQIQITGLVPAQQFPQPKVTLAIGKGTWTGTPNAIYHPRSAPTGSKPVPDSMLDHNLKGKDLGWPGSPPHASLEFRQPADPALLDAIRSGQEIRIRFEGQERVLPAVPAEVAKAYADSCAALVPPNAREAMSAKERETATNASMVAGLLKRRAELVAAEGTPQATPGGLEYVNRLLAKLQGLQGNR